LEALAEQQADHENGNHAVFRFRRLPPASLHQHFGIDGLAEKKWTGQSQGEKALDMKEHEEIVTVFWIHSCQNGLCQKTGRHLALAYPKLGKKWRMKALET